MALSQSPPLPGLEWNLVPDSHVYLTKRVADSNWVQTLEGEGVPGAPGSLTTGEAAPQFLFHCKGGYASAGCYRGPAPADCWGQGPPGWVGAPLAACPGWARSSPTC